jgi:hypothetical protein
VLAPRHRDSLEARVNAERAEDPTDVITNRFEAEVQLSRDLLRRAPVLQKA